VRAELPYAEPDPLAFDALRASAGAAELAVRVGERLSARTAGRMNIHSPRGVLLGGSRGAISSGAVHA
jgi:hypothetical protein